MRTPTSYAATGRFRTDLSRFFVVAMALAAALVGGSIVGSEASTRLGAATNDPLGLDVESRAASTLTASPAALDFGTQLVGTTSATRTVSIANNSAEEVPIIRAEVAGAMPDEFQLLTSECELLHLSPGSACEVTIAFLPTAVGVRKAQISVDWWDWSGGSVSSLVIPVSGTGTQAKVGALGVSGPDKVAKGKVATYWVRVTNVGNLPATGVVLKASGKGISTLVRLEPIGSGRTVTVQAKLRPKTAGRITTSFTVTSANAGSKTVRKPITVK